MKNRLTTLEIAPLEGPCSYYHDVVPQKRGRYDIHLRPSGTRCSKDYNSRAWNGANLHAQLGYLGHDQSTSDRQVYVVTDSPVFRKAAKATCV